MVDGTKGIETRFSKTNQPKGAGRKPAKLKQFIKDNNLGAQDVALLCKTLIVKSREELKEIAENKDAPILLSGCAAALLMDMNKGSTATINILLERAVGKVADRVISETVHVIPAPDYDAEQQDAETVEDN
jgi:hypothetical protein